EEFRQLAGAEPGGVAYEKRWIDLGIAVLGCMQIEHELGERALEPRQRFFQDNESGDRELGRGLEIPQRARFAELEMLLGLKREVSRFANFAEFLVGLRIGA